MTSIARPYPAARHGDLVTSTAAIARRTVLKFGRTPQLIIIGALQNVIFLLNFRYVFGGAISVGGGIRYVDFEVPGFVTTLVLFAGTGSTVGVCEDAMGGLVDRLRSLPIPRLAPPAGRVLADMVLLTWSLLVAIGVSFLVGFRIHTSAGDATAAFGLCLLFGFAFDWLFVVLGLFAKSGQAAQGMTLMVFPFAFVSSAYVPVETMPAPLEAFATYQPLTAMVNAVRILTQGAPAERLLGHSAEYYVLLSLAWSAVITLVFAPIAVARYWRG